jgi:hypothetical protein
MTINSSFTGLGASSQILVRHGESFNYVVSGTFAATIAIERSQNGGISWQPMVTKTVGASGTLLIENPTREPSIIRASCLAFTSGTAVVYINDVKSEVSKVLIDNTGKTVLEVVEGGVAITASAGQQTRFMNFKPGTLTSGTSTTPSITTVYLSQVYIPAKCTLTGVAVNSGATIGTDKYIVALFDQDGVALANSALAGVTTASADGFQSIPFTAILDVNGPAVYWIGLYVGGTTDRFRSIPALGAYAGLAGSATGQTFGTIANVTLPTTFTADKGPVAFVY